MVSLCEHRARALEMLLSQGLLSERESLWHVVLALSTAGVVDSKIAPMLGLAEELLHEGTIPGSASRLTVVNITMSFGHGLRGVLPSISETVGLL
eukprot:4076996-Amphidinium_carterae.1